MSLQQKLAEMKAASAGKFPAETRAVMGAAVEKLQASGILQKAVKTGAKLSDFSLPDAQGTLVELRDLRRQGPVVISLYRGVW